MFKGIMVISSDPKFCFDLSMTGNNKIISKSTTEQLIQSGDEVKLYIDLDKFHIFDKKSTKRII